MSVQINELISFFIKFSDLMSFSHWVVKLKYVDNYT